jgi:hypothetical protein
MTFKIPHAQTDQQGFFELLNKLNTPCGVDSTKLIPNNDLLHWTIYAPTSVNTTCTKYINDHKNDYKHKKIVLDSIEMITFPSEPCGVNINEPKLCGGDGCPSCPLLTSCLNDEQCGTSAHCTAKDKNDQDNKICVSSSNTLYIGISILMAVVLSILL